MENKEENEKAEIKHRRKLPISILCVFNTNMVWEVFINLQVAF